MSSKTSTLRAWSMWFVALLFFAYQFIMRLFPGLVMNNIMEMYQVDALAFGFLSSMYYFGYAGMQIPVAILLDRVGPRIVIGLSALTCSLATLLFIFAHNWQLALLARFLIGAASAAGFLGTSKVISIAFSEQQYAKMIGLSFTFGIMGALYGGKPISLLIQSHGWQNVGAIVAGLGLICALLVWLVIKPLDSEMKVKNEPFSQSLKFVLKNPYIITLALANLLMVGSLEGFADVWGVTFISNAYHLQQSDAAFIISCTFIGMIFGGPLLASIATRFSAYFMVTAACGVLIALLFAVILGAFPDLPYSALCTILFLVGIFCCYQVLVFGIGSKLVPPQHKGVTVAFLNCINMLGGSFFHLVIGSLLNAFWNGEMVEGLKSYSAHNYVLALSAIPVCSVIGSVMLIWIGYISNKNSVASKSRFVF